MFRRDRKVVRAILRSITKVAAKRDRLGFVLDEETNRCRLAILFWLLNSA
jgi:hypothetical protein